MSGIEKHTPTNLDVDLLGDGDNELSTKGLLSPTVQAIDLVLKDILEESEMGIGLLLNTKLDLSSKTVAVIGQGILVGAPMIEYLIQRKASIININIDTKNPKKLIKQADIVISAAGQPGLVDKSWVGPQTILIDAATAESDGGLVGDLDLENLYDSNLICPSPGGIGGLTVMALFYNLLKLHVGI